MKKQGFIFFSLALLLSCTERKQEKSDTVPTEEENVQRQLAKFEPKEGVLLILGNSHKTQPYIFVN